MAVLVCRAGAADVAAQRTEEQPRHYTLFANLDVVVEGPGCSPGSYAVVPAHGVVTCHRALIEERFAPPGRPECHSAPLLQQRIRISFTTSVSRR
jgi:hypothetical protein